LAGKTFRVRSLAIDWFGLARMLVAKILAVKILLVKMLVFAIAKLIRDLFRMNVITESIQIRTYKKEPNVEAIHELPLRSKTLKDPPQSPLKRGKKRV
jgi:hypothetical protein